MTYAEKLKDPRWQRKRLLIFERDNWTCLRCNSKTNNLQVHHKKYFPGCDPWEYEDRFLETLCVNCHEIEHEIIKEEEQYESKYAHLIISKTEPTVVIAINAQLDELNKKLQQDIPFDVTEEIIRNIMYLTNRKKELQQL